MNIKKEYTSDTGKNCDPLNDRPPPPRQGGRPTTDKIKEV
jgi:hypothetical protein